jgi:hypothetical protein
LSSFSQIRIPVGGRNGLFRDGVFVYETEVWDVQMSREGHGEVWRAGNADVGKRKSGRLDLNLSGGEGGWWVGSGDS